MKKDEVLFSLREYLLAYHKKGYVFHTKFIEELQDVVLKLTGKEAEIFDLLVKQLMYISEFGRQVDEVGKNEKIKHMRTEQNYYSLHLKGKGFNLRMLLTFYEDDTLLILGFFNEKSGKSATDYSKWAPILKRRYQELKEEMEDET